MGKRPPRDKVLTPDQFPSQAMRLWGRCAPAPGSHATFITSCTLVTKCSWFGRFGRKSQIWGGGGWSGEGKELGVNHIMTFLIGTEFTI